MKKVDIVNFKNAFPRFLSQDVIIVEGLIAKCRTDHQPAGNISKTPLWIENEELNIPFRVYSEQLSDSQIGNLTYEQRRIYWCIYSRHHNGHVREKCLRKLIEIPSAYSAPFVLQLLGEYVVEIGMIMLQSVQSQRPEVYRDFLKANPEFLKLLRSRIASYWNEYYRNKYPDIKKYPPYEALVNLSSA
tara:strand:+ start:633 stop:1196 length:564 start_codon:yes stop_codon:yes gene_type:complete